MPMVVDPAALENVPGVPLAARKKFFPFSANRGLRWATIAVALFLIASGINIFRRIMQIKGGEVETVVVTPPADQVFAARRIARANAERAAAAAPEHAVNALPAARTGSLADAPVRPIARAAARLPASLPPPAASSATASVPAFVQTHANVILRSGPGPQYPKVGVAPNAYRLRVKHVAENWTEVEVPGKKSAWVRSDLVGGK